MQSLPQLFYLQVTKADLNKREIDAANIPHNFLLASWIVLITKPVMCKKIQWKHSDTTLQYCHQRGNKNNKVQI